MSTDILAELGRKLDETTPALSTLDTYWTGSQPAAYLSPVAVEALQNRLRTLTVNFPRLAVTSLAERLQVTGFRSAPDDPHDDALWRVWTGNRMQDASAQAHVDALIYGRSFVIVWAGPNGPRITVESARQVAVKRDPATREVTAAVKRWTADNKAHAVVYQPEKITRYTSQAFVPEGGSLPPTITGWITSQVIPNPLGVVPVVPLVNRGRLLDTDGVSEMADLLDLADAITKLHTDALITSEFYARPRRWATGMEIVEDDEGNAVNPFGDEAGRVWQSEAPETKFGQFDPARLDGYGDLIATLTQEIGALSGLPPHYLGLHGDQPASADAIRSAEASLVARSYERQRTFGQSWDDVARLIVAVRDGTDPATVNVATVWANPETRTPAQAADAAAKLAGIGVPLATLLADQLGYPPAAIERIQAIREREAMDPITNQLLAGLDNTNRNQIEATS
jgi:hypothetical protein